MVWPHLQSLLILGAERISAVLPPPPHPLHLHHHTSMDRRRGFPDHPSPPPRSRTASFQEVLSPEVSLIKEPCTQGHHLAFGYALVHTVLTLGISFAQTNVTLPTRKLHLILAKKPRSNRLLKKLRIRETVACSRSQSLFTVSPKAPISFFCFKKIQVGARCLDF